MKRFFTTCVCMVLFACAFLPTAGAEQVTWTVDMASQGIDMSDTLYGLFYEDINYAADGGLYAELLRNRSFENRDLLNPSSYDHLTGWMFNHRNKGKGSVELKTEAPLNENNPSYMQVTVDGGAYRIVNFGYPRQQTRPGIALTVGKTYRFSLWLRNVDFEGDLEIVLENSTNQPLSNTISIAPDGGEWQKYEGFTFTATADEMAWLRIVCNGMGTFHMDMASLLPGDAYGAHWQNGGLRADLVDALMGLNPSFLRFPGGCVAEGSYYKHNFYNWKDTIGPVEQRRENENTWGYMQSYGLGYHEYFQLSEDLGALPLPVVHAGVLCQARGSQDLPVTKEEMEAFIQDVLDLCEYALGDETTYWGQKRGENGHPEPFDLQYLAIGNENWGEDYYYRYGQFKQAVNEKYPQLTCIVAAGPVAEGPLFEECWRLIKTRYPRDVVDEHYYMDSQWFLDNVNRYDAYDREGNPVFLGEYAAHEPVNFGARPNNLYSALCEGAYMTGLERNSDIVKLASYAPLFARDGFAQWTPDMIWFNERDVFFTPNYYVQQMFASTLGRYILEDAIGAEGMYTVCSMGEGEAYLKAVNVSEEEKEIKLVLSHTGYTGTAEAFLLTGPHKGAVNSFDTPLLVAPAKMEIAMQNGEGTLHLPPYSVVTITIPAE